MARTKAWALANKSKGSAYESGGGYKGVLRRGSKYGWKYEDGKTSQNRGGFDTPEEAAYDYDEFLLHYVGPNADTNQALGLLKLKVVLEIREKIRKAERPVNKADKRSAKLGASGFKGVALMKNVKNPFKAQTYHNGKYVHIGTFKTAEEAARAYDSFMLQHFGNSAVTNISLGLLPPVGEKSNVVPIKPQEPEKVLQPIPSYEHSSAYLSPEDERKAQIEAARAMGDDGEGEEIADTSTVLEPTPEPESNTSVMEDVPAPASIPKSELIVLTDAAKARQKAQAYLQLAAELEAGDIKRQAEERLNTLSSTVSKIQTVMMNLIDCCADIETEIQSLRELLK